MFKGFVTFSFIKMDPVNKPATWLWFSYTTRKMFQYLKTCLKSCNDCSHRQCKWWEFLCHFCMTQVVQAIKLTCNSHNQNVKWSASVYGKATMFEVLFGLASSVFFFHSCNIVAWTLLSQILAQPLVWW